MLTHNIRFRQNRSRLCIMGTTLDDLLHLLGVCDGHVGELQAGHPAFLHPALPSHPGHPPALDVPATLLSIRLHVA
jgi:hypothetical protein